MTLNLVMNYVTLILLLVCLQPLLDINGQQLTRPLHVPFVPELRDSYGSTIQRLPPPLGHLNNHAQMMRYEHENSHLAASYEEQNIDDVKNLVNYNLIENKPFVEEATSRCMASTIVSDTKQFEPTFVFIKPMSEVRLNATVPIDIIRSVTHFEPNKPTVILIHGFTQSFPETEWLRRIRALFEMHTQLTKYNLIIMDWSYAASNPYPRAAAMTSLMGSFLANFLNKLIKLGSNRLSFHLIAHSLGAHVAGFAGRRIKPRIGRITGLDAAGPCFGKLYSNSEQDRLNPDDAIEVDVFHYDDEFLGLGGQHGQFDVYVNGGSSQPGATDNFNSYMGALVTVVFGRKKVLSESHTRSIQVAMADLESSSRCQLVAYECEDYASFVNGECGFCDEFNNQCFGMSFPFQYNHQLSNELSRHPLRTSSPGKRLYISTKGNDPYCLFHDQVLVKFEPHPKFIEQAKKKKWQVHLELFFIDSQHKYQNQQQPQQTYQILDSKEISTKIVLTNIISPSTFSFLMLSDIERKNRFRRARLHIVNSSDKSSVVLNTDSSPASLHYSSTEKLISPRVNSIEINHMSDINPSGRRALSSRLCPVPNTSLFRNHKHSSEDTHYQIFEECHHHSHQLPLNA